jgi:hypothetical protein
VRGLGGLTRRLRDFLGEGALRDGCGLRGVLEGIALRALSAAAAGMYSGGISIMGASPATADSAGFARFAASSGFSRASAITSVGVLPVAV